jgi:hypothetical protein
MDFFQPLFPENRLSFRLIDRLYYLVSFR